MSDSSLTVHVPWGRRVPCRTVELSVDFRHHTGQFGVLEDHHGQITDGRTLARHKLVCE